MNRLSSSQILLLYHELTEEREPILTSDIAQIADAPYAKDEEGFYIYKNVSQRAAMLGYGIMKASPFHKKNAEIAGLSILTLLEINNRRIMEKEIDMPDFMRVLKAKDYDALVEWLEDNLIKKK